MVIAPRCAFTSDSRWRGVMPAHDEIWRALSNRVTSPISATKIAAFVFSYRLLVTAFPENEHLWTWAFATIACISLAVGNIAALAQRRQTDRQHVQTVEQVGTEGPRRHPTLMANYSKPSAKPSSMVT